MSALLELAERCEKAAGPSRELDIAIALALPSWTYAGKPGRFFNAGPYYEGASDRIGFRAANGGAETVPGNGPDMMVPDFTASLDAAMTLIDPDVFFHVSRFSPEGDGGGQAHIYPNRALGDDYEADAATPALALCAAALRARSAS